MIGIRRIGIYFLILFFIFLLICNSWVFLQERNRVVHGIDAIPAKKVGLVLGTSRFNDNQFFANRMQAVVELFNQGKISHIIVSGDHSTEYYNEPKEMKNALLALGISEESITQDFSGLRTLDSIVRCKMVFGQTDIIIITQEFHLYRALFIATYHGINALGYVAEDPDKTIVKVLLRELIARPLAVLDLHVFKTEPDHLGEEIKLKIK